MRSFIATISARVAPRDVTRSTIPKSSAVIFPPSHQRIVPHCPKPRLGEPHGCAVHATLFARGDDGDGLRALGDAEEPFDEPFIVDPCAGEEAEEDAPARRAAIEVADLRLRLAHQHI